MNKVTRDALDEAGDCIEHLLKKLPNLTLQEQVDVAARVKAVAKNAAAIDEFVKVEIKARRKGKAGTVVGEIFKAVLSLVPTTRLNQKKFEVEEPTIYARYLETNDVTRITFEAR